MQVNQSGEFTDITFIFLAFVPVSLLFLRAKNEKLQKIWTIIISIFLFIGILTSFHIFAKIHLPEARGSISNIFTSLSEFFTQIFAKIHLPEVYGLLAVLIGIFLFAAHKILKNQAIIGLFAFLCFYGLIFWISAFGIVWYGVLIYFLLLLVLAFGINEINSQDEDESKEHWNNKKIMSIGFFMLIGIYIFGSAIIHTFKNISEADHQIYKFKTTSQESSIFLYK